MSKVLLIGGGSLLCSYLIPQLVSVGHEVVIMDNLTGCDRFKLPKGIKLFVGNASVNDNVKTCFSSVKPDIVFINIAYAVKPGTIYNYREDTNNTISSADAIGCFLHNEIKHVYYCSTSEVYGGPEPKNPLPEDRKIVAPSSHFGNANLVAENLLSFRCNELGIPLTVLRIFDMFGPRDEIFAKTAVVNFIIEAFLNNEKIGISRADRKRDFVFAEDVADACFQIIKLEEKVSATYNVGTGTGISLDKICKELYKYIDVIDKPDYLGDPSVPIYSSVADTKLLKEKIDWQPKVNIIEYLPTLVEYTKQALIKARDPAHRLAKARGFIRG